MKNKTKQLSHGLVAIGATLLPNVAAAAELYNPLGTTSIPLLIGRIIKVALGISGSLALLMFVYGGLLWLTAAGETGKIKKGRDTLLWAVIGIAVIFGAFALTAFVIESMGTVTTPTT